MGSRWSISGSTAATITGRRSVAVGVERIFFSLVRRRTFWLLLLCSLLTVVCFVNYRGGGRSSGRVRSWSKESAEDVGGDFEERRTRDGDVDSTRERSPRIVTITGRSYEARMSRIKVYRCNGNASLIKPEVSDIRWNNRDWQSPEGTGLFLYSAFYDTRIRRVYRERHCFVRVLAMLDSSPNDSDRDRRFYCQLWLRQSGGINGAGPSIGRSVVTDAELTEIWNPQWDNKSKQRHYKPFILSCAVPRKLTNRIERVSRDVIMDVSITMRPCERATSLLPVWYSDTGELQSSASGHGVGLPPPLPKVSTTANIMRTSVQTRPPTFVVCVKPLDFDGDFSSRLIEWIEMNLLLGAGRIDVYTYRVHPQVSRVLEHYRRTGQARVIPATLPGSQPNLPVERSQYLRRNLWQKRRDELVPYNDCLYRNLYAFDYVVPLDVDELLVPRKHLTWPEMFEELGRTRPEDMAAYASFSVRNAYFLESFGDDDNQKSQLINDGQKDRGVNYTDKDLFVLSNVYRSANFSDSVKSVKSFVRTDRTLSVFNHYALETVLPGVGRSTTLPVEVVQMNHYRGSCPATLSRDCRDNFLKFKVRDVITWKYRDELRRNVKSTLTAVESFRKGG